MRLSEQREALMTSSRAPSPSSSRREDSNEPYFPTDEDALNQGLQNVSDVQDPEGAAVWLVGDQCSIADLSFLTWANVVDRVGIDLETEFPVLLSHFLIPSDALGGSKVGGAHDSTSQDSCSTFSRANRTRRVRPYRFYSDI
jgi:hypothetical protein